MHMYIMYIQSSSGSLPWVVVSVEVMQSPIGGGVFQKVVRWGPELIHKGFCCFKVLMVDPFELPML